MQAAEIRWGEEEAARVEVVAEEAGQVAACVAAEEAAEQRLRTLAKETRLAAAEEETRQEAEARENQGDVWFRVEPGGAELDRGTVWIGRVSSQVRWEDRAGRMTTWLAVELVLLGVDRLGWITAGELDTLVAVGDLELLHELAGSGKDGWGVREKAWQGSMQLKVQGGGAQRGVVGWYVPFKVVAETREWKETEVGVQMRLVAVGWRADGYAGAVACCSRAKWYLKSVMKLELRRWRVTVQIGGARDGEVLVSGAWLWQQSQSLEEEAGDTWWRKQASAEMGREQLVSDMAREEREAEEAGWPEDKEECAEERAVVDGAGVSAEFEVVERDVQYEKG